MYDCWSIHLRGEDISTGVARLGPAMRFTTMADYVTLPRARYRPHLVNYGEVQPPLVIAVPMGKGDLDYPTFLDGLDQAGFDGWVSYEMCSPLRDGGELDTLEDYAKAFLEYVTPWTT
jgi:sugar phosphate isomerase/epimerase